MDNFVTLQIEQLWLNSKILLINELDLIMLSKIKNFFLENVSINEEITEKHDTKTKVAIATCVLLLEMANTDEEFSDIEISKIESLMILTINSIDFTAFLQKQHAK